MSGEITVMIKEAKRRQDNKMCLQGTPYMWGASQAFMIN